MEYSNFVEGDVELKLVKNIEEGGRPPEVIVKSLSEYVDLVCSVTERWRDFPLSENRDTFPGERAPWFRGVKCHSYPLEPRLLREKERKKFVRKVDSIDISLSKVERYMMTRFKSGVRPFRGILDGFDINSIEGMDLLIMMQHYGLPTRLLDWSKNAYTALYFSVKNENRKGDCSVWILNPRNLVKNARIVDAIDSLEKESVNQYLEFDEKTSNNDQLKIPLPVIPSPIDLRVTAQHSRFTLHTETGGLESHFVRLMAKNHKHCSLIKIRIPYSCKPKIHRDLRLFGTTEMDIMPGVDTLANEINDRMSFGMEDINKFVVNNEANKSN